MTTRMRFIIVLLLVLVLVAAGLVLWQRVPETKPANGLHDILTLQNDQISSFDPLDAYHAGNIHMVMQIYNTLTEPDLKGKAVPSLATKWTSEDGRTWRIFLRSDVRFQADSCFSDDSQRQFKAEDVVYTFNRLLAPGSKSLGVSYFLDIAGAADYHAGKAKAIAGLKIIDTHIIEVMLESADYGFPERLTLPYTGIVPEEAVNKHGGQFPKHPVGTGPFLLEKYEPNTSVSFVRNPDYWEQGLPTLERVQVHIVTDENRAMLMFRDGEADFLELSRVLYEQYQSTKFTFDAVTATQENAQINLYLCNLSTLKSAAIRQGLSLALDREGLQDILSHQGTVAHSLFPPAVFPQLARADKRLRSDMEEAKRKLAGLYTLRLVCFEDTMSRAIAQRYARSLKELGVAVQIEAVPFPVLVERLTTGKYDLIQIYWGPIYAYPPHYLTPFLKKSFPPQGNNFNRYNNQEVDQLVERSQTMKGSGASQLMLRVQDLILADMPFVLLYFKTTVRASDNYFGMPLDPLQYRFYKLAHRR